MPLRHQTFITAEGKHVCLVDRKTLYWLGINAPVCSTLHFRNKKNALRNSVLEIAGVRRKPMSLLHALGSECWIHAGQRLEDSEETAPRCGQRGYFPTH